MDYLLIATFLLACIGLGFGLVVFLKRRRPWLETLLLSSIVGLALLPVLILLFRLLHIPLDVRIFLVLAMVGPALGFFRKWQPESATARRTIILCLVLLAAIALTAIMYAGATKYPYLEDDDPWAHALGARYVMVEKTVVQPPGDPLAHYLEPYPPYYSAMMGIFHQMAPDLNFTLKFLNALIIGMSLVAAFFAFDALLRDEWKALVGAVILGVLPAYMSHFIWAQTLAIPVFFIALWALATLFTEHVASQQTAEQRTVSKQASEKKQAAKKQNPSQDAQRPRVRWWKDWLFWTAVILVWSATIIQPSTGAIFALLLVAFGVAILIGSWYTARHEQKGQARIQAQGRHWLPASPLLAIIVGGALSFLTWLFFIIVYGWTAAMSQMNIHTNQFVDKMADTSGGVIYSISDIVMAPSSSKIDQATGLGWFVGILAFIGIVLLVVNWRKLLQAKNAGRLFCVLFLLLAIIGLEGNAFPIKVFPHRFWVFLAIAAALMAAEAIVTISRAIPNRIGALALGCVLVIVVLLTSGPARLAVQQAVWPPGTMWTSNEELSGYASLSTNLPLQTRVLPLCSPAEKAIGNDMATDPWLPGAVALRQKIAEMEATPGNATDISGDDVLSLMQSEQYQFLVIDSTCVQKLGLNRTQDIGSSIMSTGKFIVAAQSPGFILLRTR